MLSEVAPPLAAAAATVLSRWRKVSIDAAMPSMRCPSASLEKSRSGQAPDPGPNPQRFRGSAPVRRPERPGVDVGMGPKELSLRIVSELGLVELLDGHVGQLADALAQPGDILGQREHRR
eukprot:7202617-Prymnesium_polylepis.4